MQIVKVASKASGRAILDVPQIVHSAIKESTTIKSLNFSARIVELGSTTWEHKQLVRMPACHVMLVLTMTQKVLAPHATDVQKQKLKEQQNAMHVVLASTKIQLWIVLSVCRVSSRTILMLKVAPHVQLASMQKIFQRLTTKKESATTDVLSVLVESMEQVKNQLTKRQDVVSAMPVDFQN
jgi:hypothetical protein